MNKKVVCKCKQYKKQIEELKTIIEDLKAQYNTADVQQTNFINDLVKEPLTSGFTQKIAKPINEYFIDYTGILKDDTKWVDPFNKDVQKPKFDLDMFNEAPKFSLDSFNDQFEKQKTTDLTDVLFTTDTLTSTRKQEPYNPNLLPIKQVSGREKFDPDSFNKQFEQQKTTDLTDVLFTTDTLTSTRKQEPYNPNLLPIKQVSGREKFDLDEFNRQFERL